MPNVKPSLYAKIAKPALILCSIIGVLLLQFGFIFLMIALLPAIVAFFIDNSSDKSAFRVVLICNLAATLPSLQPLISSAVRMERADLASIIFKPEVWLVIYGGAAAGWCLIYLCRFIARFFIIIYFEYQVAAMERFQKKLLDEWGEQLLEEKSA